MRAVWTVVTLCLGAGLLWLIVMWPAPSPPPASAPASPAAGEPGPNTAPSAVATRAAPEEPETEPAPPPKAAEPSAAPASPPSDAKPAPTQPDLFDEVRGPLDEFSQRFEREPRDSAASDAESTVRAAFEPEQAHAQLLRAVLCRATICRLELRWNADKLGPYVAAMGRLTVHFTPEFASTVAGPEAGDRTRSVELYVERKP